MQRPELAEAEQTRNSHEGLRGEFTTQNDQLWLSAAINHIQVTLAQMETKFANLENNCLLKYCKLDGSMNLSNYLKKLFFSSHSIIQKNKYC